MMNTSTTKTSPVSSAKGLKPPREPAHVPLSLHRVTASTGTNSELRNPVELRSKPAFIDESSDEDLPQYGGNEAQFWFDQSNVNPKNGFSHSLQDEPPYFLAKGGVDIRKREGVQRPHSAPFKPGVWQSTATTPNSANEYRGVIDDLTIENKRLREENKRLKQSHTSHLAKDRLFEIIIHELSAQKRRQLENKLREFAASLDESSGSDNAKASSAGASSRLGQSLLVDSSASTSQPVDSAYKSMSNSGHTSSSNLIPANSLEGGASNQTRPRSSSRNHQFLHVPEDPLLKRTAILSDWQKKKLVVQRLEQLFTGKSAGEAGSVYHHLQQQEVTLSAPRADQMAAITFPDVEGVREAHMLVNPIEVDSSPRKLIEAGSSDDAQPSISTRVSDSSSKSPAELSEAGQRPTRPIDIDPDRAQVPSDNINYIRHLGLPTPHLMSANSSDDEEDAHGWIYLNLLINMAQLHTINVTHDFVRQAVQDISERFQISRDGNKLRWKGGSQGTHLSIISGPGSSHSQSPEDINEFDEGGGKRRKVNGSRFTTIPVDAQPAPKLSGAALGGDFHYRPLFNHTGSSSEDCRNSPGSSVVSHSRAGYADGMATKSRSQRAWSRASRSGTQSKKRREDGTMVFYSNAQFYTDLSRDCEISPQPHASLEGEGALHAHNGGALGCKPRLPVPTISRTSSGSHLSSRPFKAHVVPETEESDFSTVDIPFIYPADDELVEDPSHSNLNPPFQSFDVCGLGGIQPTDHFVIQVDTRRTIASSEMPDSGFSHHTSKPPPDTFTGSDLHRNVEFISEKIASLSTFASPLPESHTARQSEPQIRIEYLSESFTELEPSKLPEAIGYYGSSSDSDDSSDYSKFSGVSSPVKRLPLLDGSMTKANNVNTLKWTMEMGDVIQAMPSTDDEADDDEGEEEEEEEEENDTDADDSDSSIDMLAHMREAYPEAVAMQEREFDMATAHTLSQTKRSAKSARRNHGAKKR